jgi:hypothetical protein
MYYIDGPGATADHKFTEGDPAAGVAATTVTDDFMNDVQQEILSVLAAAGIAPAKGVQDQLLKAIQGVGGTGIFTTAPQFDNSKKGATTEFVKRAGGTYAGKVIYTAHQDLPPSSVGKFVMFSTGSNLFANLPFVAQVPDASKVAIYNNTLTPLSISPQAGEVLGALGNGGNPIANYKLPPSELAVFNSTPAGWLLEGGDAMLVYSPLFANSLQGAGYHKFPSGLIMQWGYAAGTTGQMAGNYPIAFPNNIFHVVGTMGDKTAGATTAITLFITSSSLANKTTINILPNGTDGLGTSQCHYIALGW